MKLIRCHVENFGCLSNIDFCFEDGLNVLYQPNGFGKSTLAAFIKAMFYGLPKSSKHSLAENERKKYLPWQGGRYGGYLDFLYENIEYRVTRFFEEKASSDTFELYDKNRRQISTRFTRDLGFELFHLDSESFLRSTYMPQQQGKIDFSTNAIRAKLGNLVEDTNDINNYDTAIEKLKSKRSFYQAYRGSSGLVNKLQGKKEDLQSKLESFPSLREQFTELTNELNSCEELHKKLRQDKDSLEEKISALSTLEAKQVKHNTFSLLNDKVKNTRIKLDEINMQYPDGYPSEEEIKTFESYASEFSDVSRQLTELKEPLDAKELVQSEQSIWEERDVETDIQKAQELLKDLNTVEGRLLQGMSQEERENYRILSNQFYKGIPDIELRQTYLQKANDLGEKIALNQSKKLSVTDQEKLEQLRNFLGNPLPTEEELSAYEKAENDIEYLTKRMKSIGDNTYEEKKPSRRTFPFLFGVLALLCGVICLILSLPIPGIIVAVIGVILLGIGFISSKHPSNIQYSKDSLQVLTNEEKQLLDASEKRVSTFYKRFFPDEDYQPSRSKEIRNKLMTFQVLQEQAEEKSNECNKLLDEIEIMEQELQKFVATFGLVVSDGDFRSALEKLNTNIRKYEELSKRQEKTSQFTEEQNTIKKQLTELAASYQYDSDLSQLPKYIQEHLNKFDNAQKELFSYEDRLNKLMTRKDDIDQKLQSIQKAYNLDGSYSEIIQKLRDDKIKHDHLNQELENARKERDEFLQQNPQATENPLEQTDEEKRSLDELTKEREILDTKIKEIEQSELPDLRKEHRNIQQKLEEKPVLQDELYLIKGELSEATLARDQLNKAIYFLEQAKTELSTKYVGQVEDKFLAYTQELIGNDMGELKLNHELDIHLEQYGEAHDLDYYSVGSIDCIILCMHLALADTLFADEPCFIILDDPFVNLDDARTERALSLLEKLGNTRQVLYLVCNNSRSIA